MLYPTLYVPVNLYGGAVTARITEYSSTLNDQ